MVVKSDSKMFRIFSDLKDQSKFKQASDFIDNNSFSIVIIKPFEDYAKTRDFTASGNITVREKVYTLYVEGAGGQFNIKSSSGIAGAYGCSSGTPLASEIAYKLSNATTIINIFSDKPKNELWYVLKDLCVYSIPIDQIQLDMRSMCNLFYQKDRKDRYKK